MKKCDHFFIFCFLKKLVGVEGGGQKKFHVVFGGGLQNVHVRLLGGREGSKF